MQQIPSFVRSLSGLFALSGSSWFNIFITAVIVGTVNRAHLAENLKAAESGPLYRDVYNEAKRRLEAVAHGLTAV